jgi:hypothetical protein
MGGLYRFIAFVREEFGLQDLKQVGLFCGGALQQARQHASERYRSQNRAIVPVEALLDTSVRP